MFKGVVKEEIILTENYNTSWFYPFISPDYKYIYKTQ